MVAFFNMMFLTLLYSIWYVVFPVHSHLGDVSFPKAHAPLQLRLRTFLGRS